MLPLIHKRILIYNFKNLTKHRTTYSPNIYTHIYIYLGWALTFHISYQSHLSALFLWGRTRSSSAWCFQPLCTRSLWPGSPARTGRKRAARPPDPAADRPFWGRERGGRSPACSQKEEGFGTPLGRVLAWYQSAW